MICLYVDYRLGLAIVLCSGGSRIRPWGEGVDLVNGVGGGARRSLKVLKVKVEVILACFSHTSINTMLNINREQSERRQN